jgi:hypothetical protein
LAPAAAGEPSRPSSCAFVSPLLAAWRAGQVFECRAGGSSVEVALDRGSLAALGSVDYVLNFQRFAMKRLVLVVSLSVVAFPTGLFGQGLADVARSEEARRKSVKSTGKVYTNGDLRGDVDKGLAATPVTVAPESAGAPPPEPSTVVPKVDLPAGKVEPPAVAKDESWWRRRITTAREAVDRSRIFADALQSRINALTNDVIARDDPAQRAQLELERQRALSELERVKKEIADQTKAIADIEEEARKAGVPPGWLR